MDKHIAHMQLWNKANKGEVTRLRICELCGTDPRELNRHSIQIPIVGHHWRGHSYPLDVWWICHRCHARLRGPFFHTGTVDKEQARQIVTGPLWKRYHADTPQDVAIITNGSIKSTIINRRCRRKDWNPTPTSYARILQLTKRAWIQFPWWRDGWMAYLIDIDVL